MKKKWVCICLAVFLVLGAVAPAGAAGPVLDATEELLGPAPGATLLLSNTLTASGSIRVPARSNLPYCVYSDGTVVVGSGFIYWYGQFEGNIQSPFNLGWMRYAGFDDHVTTRIIFTGPVVAGASLMGLFADLPYVTSIEGLEHIDTSNVTDMGWMFDRARSVTSLDLSGFDTSNVTDMGAMFQETNSLTDLDLSGFDTSNVTSVSGMFQGANSLTGLDLSGFDTRNVVRMGRMFAGASSVTSLDLSGFDTQNVGDMGSMFAGASSLTSLDLSGWDTGNVTWIVGMFLNTPNLRQLTLSEQFQFVERYIPWRGLHRADLGYSGETYAPTPGQVVWQNIGSGTSDDPQGEFVFTSTELMENFDGTTMADTWVWSVAPEHQPISFTDVATTDWFFSYVRHVANNNIMQGTDTETFEPRATFIRAQVVATLYRMVHGGPSTQFPYADNRMVFDDVAEEAWFSHYVAWAYDNDIVQGLGNNRFGGAQYVTREQFAAMLHRFAAFRAYDVAINAGEQWSDFTDIHDISDWAEDAFIWANYHGLITGRTATTIVPGGTAQRAEAAAILTRFMQTFGE